MKILLICPSYQRAKKIDACIQAWRDTTSGKSDLLLVLENEDQHEYPRYDDVKYLVGNYGSVGKAMNEAVLQYDYPIYGFIGDDHHFRTKGWEERVIDTLKDGGYAYGNDLLQGGKLATQVFITGDIIKKLGYMAHPSLTHLYIDDYWMEMGNAIGKLHYMEDVVIEHMHPGAGKDVMDEAYIRVNAGTAYTNSLAAFNHWKNCLKEEEVCKLR